MKTLKDKKTNKKQFYIDNVAKFCDKCGAVYELGNIKIIQETGNSAVMHFLCPSCKSENVANFLSPAGLTTKIPINCDLGLQELKKFTTQEIISLDDVLELHVSLEDNEGYVKI